MHDHVHDENCKPKSAIQEAMALIAGMGENAIHEVHNAKWYQLRTKYYLRGVAATCNILLQVLYSLEAKYDNTHGDFN